MPEITTRTRPGTMRLLDATQYRLPPAGWVSILHRGSGLWLVVLLPFLIWLLDTSLTSEISFDTFKAAFAAGIGVVPAWLVKLVVLSLIWAYVQHFVGGVRHLWMDMTHSVSKDQGRVTAVATLAITALLTLALGAKLFGLF